MNDIVRLVRHQSLKENIPKLKEIPLQGKIFKKINNTKTAICQLNQNKGRKKIMKCIQLIGNLKDKNDYILIILCEIFIIFVCG